jgi:phosphonate transport system substrate-binding protein
MMKHCLAAAALAAALVAGPARAETPSDLNVGVIATDTSTALKVEWQPLMADLEKAIGRKVNGFYASDYAGVIEAMRFNKVQLCWFGNASAVQAVDRADGEIFAKAVGVDGTQGYYSLLIVHKDSPIKSLQDIIDNPGKYTFGNGDPNSTSGYLMPSYYAWAKNHIDIAKQFSRIATGNHQSNMVAVAMKHVDVATNNTEDMAKFLRNEPERASQVREIWRSPLIPGDPLVYRKDLPDELKAKIRSFFLTYGTPQGGEDWERQKKVLAALSYTTPLASDNSQLLPIRQVALFRDKLKVQDDANLSAEDKAKRIAELDARLADLDRQMAAR